MDAMKQNKELLANMFSGKLKLLLAFIASAVIVIAGYLAYLYQKGSTTQYHPPAIRPSSSNAQVVSDLMTLSQAIEAYHAKNLRYPERLEQLLPEFLDKMPLELKTGNNFIYESDGMHQYRVSMLDPTAFGLKELFIENGKIIQK
jgi:hypothetical protein